MLTLVAGVVLYRCPYGGRFDAPVRDHLLHMLRSTFRRCTSALLLCVLAGTVPAVAKALEDEIRAAFFFNFLKFVTFPAESATAPIMLACVLSGDPFVQNFDELTGRSVGKQSVEAVVLSEVPRPDLCDALYFHPSYKGDVVRALEDLKRGHVLTVGESPGFLEAGGIINLVRHDDKVRFDVSLKNARESGLTVSARLIRVAREVREGPAS
jgi:hypothetical protein